MKDRSLGQLRRDNYQNLTNSEREGLSQISEVMSKMGKFVLNELPQQAKDAFDLFLKEYGWHIRTWMSFEELTPYIKQGHDAVDKYFIRKLWLSKWMIKRNAIKRFPKRKRAIELAFKAHGRGEFELSIPAFLILSEGIFREMSGSDIFAKRDKEKNEFLLKLKANSKVIPLMSHIIEAVVNGDIIGLRFSNEEYLRYPHVLHRNRIIHGADENYGTKVNSYKAMSQFEFITETVYMAVNEKADF